MAKAAPQQMRILTIDAWGNADEGWEWNSWRQAGTAPRSLASKSDKTILQYMHKHGYITQVKGGAVEDDQYNKIIVDAETGQPLFALEYGSAF